MTLGIDGPEANLVRAVMTGEASGGKYLDAARSGDPATSETQVRREALGWIGVMADQDRRPPARQAVHGSEYRAFDLDVHGTRRFVQHDDGSVLQERAREGQ